MGLYYINCPECGATCQWFSGDPDSRCFKCRGTNKPNVKDKEDSMDYEQRRYDDLNKIISVQDQLIQFLKAEVERLKASQPSISYPGPIYPTQQPPWPIQQPIQQPLNPLQPPFTITCKDGAGNMTLGTPVFFTGEALPQGSVQSGTYTTCENKFDSKCEDDSYKICKSK